MPLSFRTLGSDLLLLASRQGLAMINSHQPCFNACFDFHKFVSPFCLTMLYWLQSNPVGNLSEFRAFFCFFSSTQ
jgi:hypothetical protein